MRASPFAPAALCLLGLSAPAAAQLPEPKADEPAPASAPAPPASASPDERRAQARAFFESGLAHFDRGEWSAALAEFLRSRELFPTRSATKNAAVCFRKEGRFDEALDMLEDLLRTYADLSPSDRAFAEHEIAELRGAVGALDLTGAEPGATLVVDSRTRGTYPPTAPIRVPAGTHVVRVYKEGFVPFERRVDVAGRQVLVVDAKLDALTEGGRLAVTEASGRPLDVVVDNVVVGTAPWEGTLSLGHHTVALRGPDDQGTQPVDASVRLRDITRLSLSAEALDASLRIAPTPAGATVSIDSVVMGQGVWEGKLRSGAHKVEIAAEGFVPQSRDARLAKGERGVLTVALERDLTSPLWRAAHPARVFVELDGGPSLGLVFGGDVRGACTGGCSAPVPIGLGATLHGGYELSSGLALGIDAGFLLLSAGTTSRAAQIVPKGLPPDGGTVDDLLALRGFRIGPSAAYRRGDSFPITLRLAAGVFFGSAGDGRTGSFAPAGGAAYPVSVSESSRAIYAYVAPEVRVGTRVWSRLEVSAGVALMVLAALDQPTWVDRHTVLAAPAGKQGDGVASFGPQTLAGAFLLTAVPSVGLRYAF